jgi:uncharacterized SAM-binding protein YcdF (DUF218 family)
MTSLLRAWLLDPVALLFVFSIVLFVALLRPSRRRSRSRSSRSGPPRWAWPAFLAWVALYLVCSAPIIVNPLIALVEDPYLSVPACPAGSHLVLLGGGVDSRIVDSSEFARMRPATLARATAAAQLAATEPQTRVIVAGGALKQIAEAEVIAAYLVKLGVGPAQIVQETASSNTRENAVNVAALLADETVTGPVRLLTSAMHMPRALQTFKQVLDPSGVQLCPVSVDVQALKEVPPYALMPQTTAIARFDLLLHELVALMAYKVRGWI